MKTKKHYKLIGTFKLTSKSTNSNIKNALVTFKIEHKRMKFKRKKVHQNIHDFLNVVDLNNLNK